MMKRLTASILKEDRFYVAQCLEVDVASQGNTEVEALGNLREALELHFEPPQASETPQLQVIEIEIGAA
jgi:predicted RNase H-like HicB family nuclease